jgi:hypothetical protein
MSDEGFTVYTLRQELSYLCFLYFWGILMCKLLVVFKFGKKEFVDSECGLAAQGAFIGQNYTLTF